jgi:NitT/TauT family transport system permease protein
MTTAPAPPLARAASRSASADRLNRIQRLLLGILGTGSLIATWQLGSSTGVIPRSALPGPAVVGAALPDVLFSGEFLGALGDTLLSWIIALALGSVAGILIGLTTSVIPFLQRPSMAVVNVARSIPVTALLPLAILLFGLATEMKVAMAFWAIIWPIIINTSYGVLGTEPLRLDAARSLRWPWWRRQAFVTLPSALPSILTGIRIATGTALVVVIAAELLGARAGVGTYLRLYQQASRPDVVYAAVIVVGLLGALLYTVLTSFERRAVAWRNSA